MSHVHTVSTPLAMPGILDLLVRPFGPYPEDDILSEKFHKGDLTSFSMECGHEPIGFDETEYMISAARRSRIATDATEFFGILVIEELEWLSSQGKEWLQRDLHQRDLKMNPQWTESGVTLLSLYGNHKGEGLRLSVWINGEKILPARFMTSNPPHRLVLKSRNNTYNLRSLDVGTFRDSQMFLAQYRLWALVNEIIKTDPDNTPTEDRTIHWLIKSYLDRFRQGDLDHHFFSPSCDVDRTPFRRRHLRHLPRAEMMGLFAAHAEWLLAQQLASRHGDLKILNICKWITFCEQVEEAKKRGVLQGQPHGHSNDHTELSGRLSRFGNDQAFWQAKINNALKKKVKPIVKYNYHAMSPNNQPSVQKIQVEPQFEFAYDSDFSEASTSSFTDSSSEEEVAPRAKIPLFLLQPPTIPSGSFEWWCPASGCDYSIDFLDLTTENTDILPPAEVRHLKETNFSEWNLQDKRVQEALQLMVQVHNDAHHPPQTRHQIPERGVLPTRLPLIKVEDDDEVVIVDYNGSW